MSRGAAQRKRRKQARSEIMNENAHSSEVLIGELPVQSGPLISDPFPCETYGSKKSCRLDNALVPLEQNEKTR